LSRESTDLIIRDKKKGDDFKCRGAGENIEGDGGGATGKYAGDTG